MAKKDENKKKLSFTQVGELAEKMAEKNSITIDSGGTQKTFIGSGVYILNALLAKSILSGGVLDNRITAFAGESGVGKSFLCYSIAAQAQAAGYSIIYIDTEYAIELEDLPPFGIDTSKERFSLWRSNNIEDLKVQLAQYMDMLKEKKKEGYELPKMMVILDSVGMMASKKEVEDAVAGKSSADMSRSKALKALFRILVGSVGFLRIPMVVSNHTYMSMDLFPKEILNGGTGLQYTASSIIFLSKAKHKTGDEDEMDMQSGIVVTAKSFKNRLAKCGKKIKFIIDFNRGMNPFTGLELFCTAGTYERVGIFKGKLEVDKSTGEMIPKEGGNRWYVRHLGKSVPSSQLHNPQVFTPEVLQALEPIIAKYFSYGSEAEIEEAEKEFMEAAGATDGLGEVNLDDMDADDFFDKN